MTKDSRPKVLVSAFACHPEPKAVHFPGEAVLGWFLVKEIERFADCHVMTWARNREAIQKTAGFEGPGRAVFHFLDLPAAFYGALGSRHYGLRFYYFLWQKLAGSLAGKLHSLVGFELSHQITFANDWMPSFMGPGLPIPFIWGPLGGGQKVAPGLMSLLTPRDRRRERMRVRLQSVWRKTRARLKTAEAASAVLVCNNETKRVLEPWKEKIVDFPVNGITAGSITESVNERQPGQMFRVFYAGRFDGIKGIPLALRAFAILAGKYPDVEFVLGGEGPERERLEAMASEPGLSGHVRFLPWLSRSGVLTEMRRSHVFLFPSLRDGGGAVVVEAMASGLPVICLDAGGPGFHVSSEWGFKLRTGNPDAVSREMASALEILYLDEQRRMRLAAAGRSRASEYYSWKEQGERLERIYERVLSGGK